MKGCVIMNRFEVVFTLFNGSKCSFTVHCANRDMAVYKATLLYWVNFPHDDPDYSVVNCFVKFVKEK